MKRLRAVDVPGVPEAPEPHVVPAPPEKGLTTYERETWLELAPQVTAREIYDPSLYTAFRLLVVSVAEALSLGEDAPETARARAIQSAQAAMGRWGLSPKDRRHASKAEGNKADRHGKWRR